METETAQPLVYFITFNWVGILQLILVVGVLAYGVWHLITRQSFNLLLLIFWIVCGYLALAALLLAAGLFYRGQGMSDLSFALGNFMQWAMTIVLFGFLPLTLLAAAANKWSGGQMPGDERRDERREEERDETRDDS
ncbi:MAG: hypothetical protein AAGH82_05330 [Pseudomonadota bacterium]